MAAEIMISRRKAGKSAAEEALYADFVQQYKASSPTEKRSLLFYTPSQMTFSTEKELIERLGGKGIFGTRVFSRASLERLILEEAGVQLPELLDEHGRMMMVQKAASDVSDELSLYRGAYRRSGFSIEAAREIALFEDNGVVPDQLEALALLEEGTPFSNKIKDLSKIYTAYLSLLGEDRLDSSEKTKKVLEVLPEITYFQDKTVYILGYTNLSSNDIDCITAMAAAGATIKAAFITDIDPDAPDASAFEGVNLAVERLLDRLKEAGVDRKIESITDTGQTDLLSRVEAQLLSYQEKKLGYAAGQIFVQPANTIEEEVEDVTTRTALLIQNGVDPADIAILVPSMDLYAPRLERSFKQAGVSGFTDQRRPVIQSSFIMALLYALDTVVSGFKREELLSFVKSPFSRIMQEEADLFENFLIETGIQPHDMKKPFTRERILLRIHPDHRERARAAEVVRENLMDAFSLLKKGRGSYAEHIENIRLFLKKIRVQETIADYLETFRNQGQEEEEMLFRQIYRVLDEVLTQMETALGEEEGDLSEIINVLKNGLSTYSVGVVPEKSGLVEITDVHRGKRPRAKYIFLMGLSEGLFPKAKNRSGLFSKQEMESLAKLLEMPILAEGHSDEYAYYNAFTKASKEIHLSYPRNIPGESGLKPSRFLEHLEQTVHLDCEEQLTALMRLRTARPERILAAYSADRREGKVPADPVLDAARMVLDEEREESLEPVVLAEQFTGADDTVPPELARALYSSKGRMHVSASQLETYASCPYHYYLSHGIGLREREEYEVRALDTGNLMHAFFESFYTALGEQGLNLKDAADPQNPLLEKIVGSVLSSDTLKEHEPRYDATYASRYTYDKLKRMLTSVARVQAAQLVESGFTPRFFEKGFSRLLAERDGERPQIVLTGRIDRIDLKDGRITVVDYKSGKGKELKFSMLLEGLSLQLLLYLEEAVKLIERLTGEKSEPAGSFYASLNLGTLEEGEAYKPLEKAKMFGIGSEAVFKELKKTVVDVGTERMFDERTLKDLLSYTGRRIEELAKEIADGKTDIAPYAEAPVQACRYCRYKHICRIDQTPEKERKLAAMTRDDFMSALTDDSASPEEGER